MKSITAILVLCLFGTASSWSQWNTDVRLTNVNSGKFTALNNSNSFAANGQNLHIVWDDYRDGGVEVYYKRSTDGGVTWGTDTRLTNNSMYSGHSGVACSGSTVHVVWEDNRDGQFEVYYKRSINDGATWGPDSRLTTNTTNFYKTPSVSVSGNSVNIVYTDNRSGFPEVYYNRSTDAGVTWGTQARLTNSNYMKYSPAVSVAGSLVHVTWYDLRDGNEEIYYKRSTDGGATWGADVRLTNDPESSRYPSICSSGNMVHIAWSDYRAVSTWRIYYKRSSDAGLTWIADSVIAPAYTNAYYPSIVSSGSFVHLVWQGDPTTTELYYKYSTNNGFIWNSNVVALTSSPANAVTPSIGASSSDVFAVWVDSRDTHNEIYFKKNPGGNAIGITQTSTLVPSGFSLSQNYPNPFNPFTKFQFAVSSPVAVKISVYDILGKIVDVLVDQQLRPGTYEAHWNASNYPSGIYLYKLTTAEYSETKKMVLIK